MLERTKGSDEMSTKFFSKAISGIVYAFKEYESSELDDQSQW